MQFTQSLKKNYEFRRIYAKGKHAADSNIAVYCRKNRLNVNRLGITVGSKIGNAVKRNRLRRRIREAYRLNEASFRTGFDVVVVGRVRASYAEFDALCRSLLKLMNTLNLTK